MPIRDKAVPLLAVDAVVLDLETTGLDTRADRIVEIGALKLRAGKVPDIETVSARGAAHTELFSLRVNPGIAIPPASTAIHGIADADVADAPQTAEALARLAGFRGDSMVIGHAIGFDLAFLKAETGRTGGQWPPTRSLDTRMLAEIARPDLPDFSLELVCDWLGITPHDRHSALGDVIATAEVFLALVPRLRDRNIRTVAEAEAACATMLETVDTHAAAGWMEPSRPDTGTDNAVSTIDSYPYRHRIAEIMSAPPLTVGPDKTLLDAARRMDAGRASSLFVTAEGQPPGIVTERDILRAVAAGGPSALASGVATIASRPLQTVPAEAYVYLAMARMDRLKVRHLAVVDESGDLAGAVSARDLLKLRASAAIRIGDGIENAADIGELASIWADLPAVAETLVGEAIDGRQVAGIISQELRTLTCRAAVMAEARMRAGGAGDPPQPYAVLVLGSGGRGESLLAMDQDNAIVFASGEPGGEADRYFAELGRHMCAILDEVGVPLCKGGVMAQNPEWRGSMATWRERIETWVRRSAPGDLLSVDIFFDMTAVHGDAAMAETLFAEAYALGGEDPAFAKQLAAASADFAGAFGLFGKLRTDNGRIDLKTAGLFPIVSTARVLAICHGIARRNTRNRLSALVAARIGGETDLLRFDAAHEIVLTRILAQQIADIHAGQPPGNKVALKGLKRDQRDALRDALGHLRAADSLVRDLLFRAPG